MTSSLAASSAGSATSCVVVSLPFRCARAHRLTIRRALGTARQHNHDLLHLDLKCSNVLLYLDESHGDLIPRPLISDFGTTRRVVYFPADGDGGRRTGNTVPPFPTSRPLACLLES